MKNILDTNSTLLECFGIKKSFGKKEVLKNINIKINKGELVGLIGENGSGKSTLLRCILNMVDFNEGTVFGKPSIGYCPQENYLFSKYTLIEHINLFLSILRKTKNQDVDFISKMLYDFKLVSHKDTMIEHLSSGTYQKLKFITSFLNDPDLIILDEPYDGFDWEMYNTFWKYIETLKKQGKGILLVSHFLHDFEKFDRIYEIKEGTSINAKC